MKILVTGGAGYIGSHVVKQLGAQNADIVIIDNLSTGHPWAVLNGELIEADLGDQLALDNVFSNHEFDAVIHFAANIVVPESVQDPLKYYTNNTANTLRLLRTCHKYGIKRFVFSSTAAVYGVPESPCISESFPLTPINPYGASKMMSERMLMDLSSASDMNYVIFRYFNVAGADHEGRIGQATPEATHLIKVACEAALGKRPYMEIFGTDYPTDDGTCVRDYIHVDDLARAHLDAVDYLINGGESSVMNCGYGHGASVKEVIDVVKKVSGKNFEVRISGRREGDPPALMADNKKIISELGWTPQYDDLEYIVQTAYNWEEKLGDMR